MPRSLSAEREREFQELFGFVDFYTTHFSHVEVPSELSISTVCAEIVQKYGKSRALKGLRQATNDIIEELSGKSAEGISLLDEALRMHGIVTVSEVRRRYASSFKRIIKRGHIRNETEYYLINGIVLDQATGIEDDERASLQQLLIAYEEMRKRPR